MATVEQAFPRLTEDELAAVREVAVEQCFNSGEFVFEAGQVEVPFFVVLEGRIRVIENTTGMSRLVTVHNPGAFTGDVDMLTGRPVFVSAVAAAPTKVLRLEFHQLRPLLNKVPSLGERFMVAFQARRQLLEQTAFTGIKVFGSSKETITIREFLYKNSAPCTWFDTDQPDTAEALKQYEEMPTEFPVVDCGQGRILVKPSLKQLADCTGIRRPLPEKHFGLVIIGAGPSGLAAAVYATSEGIDTLVLDTVGPGGQAGTTSRIENFIGFPAGLSGGDLAARAYLQVLKFGGIVSCPVCVKQITQSEHGHVVETDDGAKIETDCVLIATGVRYRFLTAQGAEKFLGAGIYHAATSVEANLCSKSHVAVVGAGNSAGQAAMYMSEIAESVKMIVRADTHAKGMSSYLAERIAANPKIEVLPHCEVNETRGDGYLQTIKVVNNQDGSQCELPCTALFVFIGSDPNTEWLPESIERDDKGFIKTGPAAKASPRWKADRDPCPLETTCPGIFAAGDVRSGNTRRVAFAAGDGAMAITCVNQYRARL